MSRIDRKRAAAHERLLDAAAELISDKGVEGLRLRELTELADIGFGSFYNHFTTKEELVEAVVAECVGSATETIILRASEADDPAETAAIAHRLFIRLLDDNRQLAWLIVRLDRGDALLEAAAVPRLGPVLERGIAAGRFKGIDTDVMISFIVGATISVMRGLLEGRLPPETDVASARTLLRACGLSDEEAGRIARSELEPIEIQTRTSRMPVAQLGLE